MRKKSLTFLTAILSLVAVMLFAIPFGGCAKEEELPVWQLSETVTASFTDNGKYGYILTVDGTGAIPDYPSENATYWAGKSGRVTDIVVSDGITSIGENAFAYCYYVKSVTLPASVKSVGKNAFPAGTKIYCYATEVAAGEGMTVYAYSESKPTAGGNFWHDANGTPAVWPSVVTSPQKILFIGNSYTFYNEMPTIFENIATAAGAEVTVESVTTGSQSLRNWADPATEDGARVESKLTENKYDIIVLQEKSTSPVNDDYRYFVSGAKALAKRIGETQDNCRIFLYETWGSPAYAGTYGGSIPVMESRLRAAYDTVAESIGATVSYVGKAFTYMYENYGSVDMYNTVDKNHPSYEGSYLAACVHATTLLGLDVTNADYNGTLDADTAELLRLVGYSIATGEDIPEITYDMQIAVYSRYADSSVIAKLVTAFKEDYAAKNGVEAPNIKYSLLGVSNTNVATFGELVNAGSYDIILASGNNIDTVPDGTTSGGNVSIIEKKKYHVKDSAYPNGGDRYISRLTENELAVALYNFIDSDVAKGILDPDYVSEENADKIVITFMNGDEQYGETLTVSNATDAEKVKLPVIDDPDFKGWTAEGSEVQFSGSIGYSDVESLASNGTLTLHAMFNSKPVLRIGYYTNSKNPVSDENQKAIKDAFALINPDVEIEFVAYVYSASKLPITAMVTDINNRNSDEDGTNDIDCLFNFPSAGTILTGLTYVEDAAVQVGDAEKYVVQVRDSELANQFFEFAKTDTTITTI